MTPHHRWTLGIAALLVLHVAPAQAQYYGGGSWGYGGGGYGGGQTVQGSIARGMGVYAAGAGQYNVRTAQANAINANTAMQYNQYLYASRLESARIYHAKLARDQARSEKTAEAIRLRLRDNPNEYDLNQGDALNVALDELNHPMIYDKAVYAASKKKVGGEAIRDIPFNYASAAITISVHQLTQGGAPDVLKNNPAFAPDREALRAVAAEMREQGDANGRQKPETIAKAKTLILATKAKIEATLPKDSPDRMAAEKYVKALYGFVKMLDTPAVNVLLAGVEKHPDASLGDLLQFMADYNLRFGVATTPRQKEIYRNLYSMLVQVRNDVTSSGPLPPMDPSTIPADAPIAAFDKISYDHIDNKTPPPPPTPR